MEHLPTVDELLNCAPNFKTQISLLVIWGLIWYFFIPFVASSVVEPYVRKQSYFKQFTTLNKLMLKNFGVIMDEDEDAFKFGCKMIPIIIQHILGGILCMPSMFNIYDAETNASLACMGGLIEASWEFQDGLVLFRTKFFGTEEQKKTVPNSFCIIMALHHCLGLSMVIPMNIFHRQNVYYHELIFLLQFAAAVALGASNYGYTLDITKKSGLFQMQICAIFTFIVITYSRFFRFIYVLYKLVMYFYGLGLDPMFIMGVVAAVAMGLLNFLFFMDSYGKMKKFLTMSIKEDVDKEILRQSSSDFYKSASGGNAAALHTLTPTKKRWAKLKGAVRMGAFKNLKKNLKKNAGQKKDD